MKKSLVTLAVFLFCHSLSAQYTTRLSSPDESLRFHFSLSAEGTMHYHIERNERPVIHPSTLGLDGWESGLVFSDITFESRDTVWHPVYGERSMVKDRYNACMITLLLRNDPFRILQLQVRAYDEGIAFRYVFPEHPEGGKYVYLKRETTGFTLPEGTMAWHTGTAQGAYQLLPLRNWKTESERPLTLELPDSLYVCLAEAEMVHYARTRFALHASKPNTLVTALHGPVDYHTPFHTPWRVVMVAEKPGDLLANNDLLLNLNPPNRVADTDWIKPGKIMREVTLSMKGARELVDFAVKRNLQYIHFDAGWYGYEYVVSADATAVNVDPRRNPNSDLDLPAIIRYAGERGIGVFLYVNQRALYQQLDVLLPLYRQWGVKGIKFGFVHVGSQHWTTWLHEAVKKCAEHNLLVNIHDEYRPTGFSRTYPNLLTQEGIRGNEEMPDATNSTIQAFTRLVAGAADHTICYYHRPELKMSLASTQNPRVMKTTSGHQLALAVVMYSPLQYLYWYDTPEDAADEPELAFFDRVPTVFDDTRVINGAIGQYITIARRKGAEWFVGAITNNDARALSIPLHFLEPGKKYRATLYADDVRSKVRTKVSVRTMTVDASLVLDVKLAASGGLAVWIQPL